MQKLFKKILIVTVILTAFINSATVYATPADYYDNGFFKFNGFYVNRIGVPIIGAAKRGIDVSFYQGDIDWNKVAQNDVSFAFVRCGSYKAGQGPDSKFSYNMSEAKRVGIKRGIYIASIADTPEFAEMEAYYVLHCARETKPEYPLVIDIEGATHASKSPEELRDIAEAFCRVIESAGYVPMVYSSYNWFTNKIADNTLNKWVAQYGDACTYEKEKWYWQCTSHGYIPGIEGRVDINLEFDNADPTGIKKELDDSTTYQAEVPDALKETEPEVASDTSSSESADDGSVRPKSSFDIQKYLDSVDTGKYDKPTGAEKDIIPDGTKINSSELTEENGWIKK